MDDNEFRKRAFSDPRGDDPDLHDAARGNSGRQKLMAEIAELEERISSAISAVPVPADLVTRLKQQVEPTPAASHNPGRYFLLAAMVVVAVAVTIMFPGIQDNPSAQDLAFRDNLIEHLHREAPAYDGDSSAHWSEASSVLTTAGVLASGSGQSRNENPLRAAGIKFARHCDLGDAGRSAHIVLEGERGPVSVIFAANKPVDHTLDIEDERFHGRIIPTEHGNMAIIGEQGEVLTDYEVLVTDSIGWSI